jgi:hypothetical protein
MLAMLLIVGDLDCGHIPDSKSGSALREATRTDSTPTGRLGCESRLAELRAREKADAYEASKALHG